MMQLMIQLRNKIIELMLLTQFAVCAIGIVTFKYPMIALILAAVLALINVTYSIYLLIRINKCI